MTLLGEWLFNEAASGTAPTSILDYSAGTAVNLTPTYTSTAAWSAIGAGRGLGLGTLGTAGALSAALGTNKIQSGINGGKLLTWEVVINYAGFPGGQGGSTICDIGDAASGAQMGVYSSSDDTKWEIWISNNGTVMNGTITKPSAGTHVFHLVVDTNQATFAGRLVAYVDGSAVTVTSTGGLAQNTTLSVVSTSKVCVGFAVTSDFGSNGTVYYLAVWNEALSAATVAQRALTLKGNNDLDPSSQPPLFFGSGSTS